MKKYFVKYRVRVYQDEGLFPFLGKEKMDIIELPENEITMEVINDKMKSHVLLSEDKGCNFIEILSIGRL